MHYDELKIDLLFASCFAHPSVMMRAEILRRGGFCYDPHFSRMEDYDLWDRISVNHQIATLPDVLLQYRKHPSQVTSKRILADSLQILEIKRRQISRLGLEANGKGFMNLVCLCNGDFIPTRESVLILNSYFNTLKQQNDIVQIYNEILLDRYFITVITNLLYGIPFIESLIVSRKCGISILPYVGRRLARSTINHISRGDQRKAEGIKAIVKRALHCFY